MMKKSLLLIGVVSLFTMAFAGTKSYSITFIKTAKAGSVELPAGDYMLKVDNGKAIFTDTRTLKSQTVPVKVETNGHKFAQTEVDSKTEGSAELLESIGLGGSTTKIEFSN